VTYCPEGYYSNQDTLVCDHCSENCLTCIGSIDNCASCSSVAYNLTDQDGTNSCIDICGNGARIENKCDDGNTNDHDGCSSSCEVEENWKCSNGNETFIDSCIDVRPLTVVAKTFHNEVTKI